MRFLFIAVLVFATRLTAMESVDQRTVQQGIEQGYPKLVAALDSRCIRYEDVTWSIPSLDATRLEKTLSTRAELHLRFEEGLVLVSRDRSDDPSGPGLKMRNPLYTAIIDDIGVGGGYAISELDTTSRPKSFTIGINDLLLQSPPTAAFQYRQHQSIDLFGPEFEFVKAWKDTFEDSPVVKVEFLRKPKAFPEGYKIEIGFSPEDDWAMRYWDEQHPQGRTYQQQTLQDIEESVIPKKVVKESFLPGKLIPAVRNISTIEPPVESTLSPEQFYLSHYGLPEPTGSFWSRFAYLAALAGFGIILMSLAVVGWLKRNNT